MNIFPVYKDALPTREALNNYPVKPMDINNKPIVPKEIDGEENTISFENIINHEIEKLNNQYIRADNLTNDFISGESEDLHEVIIATEEASLSLDLAIQIRNRLVEAYKEINNMQL